MDIEYLKKRGEEFLKTSEYHIDNEMYDLAAFDLEQALQLFLKYTIFLKIKTYPPTHSLKSLFKILSEAYNNKKELNKILKNKYQLIGNLEQSYISSRYLPYSYTKEEVLEFKKFMNEVVEFLEKLWEEEINDILIEISKTNKKYFKNYLKYSKIIAKIAKKTFKNSKVLLFGSILKSKNPQDIDILIVSDDIVNKNLRDEFFIEFNKKIEFINPFEIHFATESQFENFYKYFLDKFILIE